MGTLSDSATSAQEQGEGEVAVTHNAAQFSFVLGPPALPARVGWVGENWTTVSLELEQSSRFLTSCQCLIRSGLGKAELLESQADYGDWGLTQLQAKKLVPETAQQYGQGSL